MLQYEIRLVGPTVTNPVVGERAELKVVVFDGQNRVSAKDGDVEWTLQGDPVATYVMGKYSGKVYPLERAALRNAKLGFNWARGGSFVLMVKGIGQGATVLPASKTFDVSSPTLGADCGGSGDTVDVRVDPFNSSATYLRYGQVTASPRSKSGPRPGIVFTYSATAPNSRKIDGIIAGVQLIKMKGQQKPRGGTPDPFVVYKGTDQKEVERDWYLDTAAPYALRTVIAAGRRVYWTDSTGDYVSDSPCVQCRDGDEAVEFSIDAAMYLMYRPDGAESIWVTLGIIMWGANGKAERSSSAPNNWILRSSQATKQTGMDLSEEFPEWEANVTNNSWVPE